MDTLPLPFDQPIQQVLLFKISMEGTGILERIEQETRRLRYIRPFSNSVTKTRAVGFAKSRRQMLREFDISSLTFVTLAIQPLVRQQLLRELEAMNSLVEIKIVLFRFQETMAELDTEGMRPTNEDFETSAREIGASFGRMGGLDVTVYAPGMLVPFIATMAASCRITTLDIDIRANAIDPLFFANFLRRHRDLESVQLLGIDNSSFWSVCPHLAVLQLLSICNVWALDKISIRNNEEVQSLQELWQQSSLRSLYLEGLDFENLQVMGLVTEGVLDCYLHQVCLNNLQFSGKDGDATATILANALFSAIATNRVSDIALHSSNRVFWKALGTKFARDLMSTTWWNRIAVSLDHATANIFINPQEPEFLKLRKLEIVVGNRKKNDELDVAIATFVRTNCVIQGLTLSAADYYSGRLIRSELLTNAVDWGTRSLKEIHFADPQANKFDFFVV
jgi:hypothetical protein